MSEYHIETAENVSAGVWDDFVRASNEGTIFHEQEFLAYHGERFKDVKKDIVILKGNTVSGLMPAALFYESDGVHSLRSPYGASLGGPVFKKTPKFKESMQIIDGLLEFLRAGGIRRCSMTLPTQSCYSEYSETFRLALLQSGFVCANRDISSVVILKNFVNRMESRARNMIRKADSAGIKVVRCESKEDFWLLLMKTYVRFDKKPTHSYEELNWLITHFPERIVLDIAYLGSVPVAGVCSFALNTKCNMAFYLVNDPEYQHVQGLSSAVYETLLRSERDGFTCYDFGTSSDRQVGRENIFSFKESFGAVGIFREQYRWDENK